MTFGFPAHAEGSVSHSLPPRQIDIAVEDALTRLGWKFSWHGGLFRASRGTGLPLFGQTITIDASHPGLVHVKSRGKFTFQCIDCGVNRRNVERFLATLDLG